MLEIVRREFETHLHAEDAKAADNFKKAAKDLLKRPVPADIKAAIDNVVKNLEARTDEVAQVSTASFDAWTKENGVEDMPLSGNHVLAAMNAYFTAGKPFKTVKERENLPDAMIYQSLLQLVAEGPLVLVSFDGNLSKACTNVDDLTVYKTLQKLIASDAVQTLIIEDEAPKKAIQEAEIQYMHMSQSIKAIIERLKHLSCEYKNVLTSYISSNVGESLATTIFKSPSIPGDDREAYILSSDVLDEVNFEWEQAVYHGNSIYMVPFQAIGYFYIRYYVSKWDVKDIENRGAIYSEHNDYLVKAEEDAQLSISGALRILIASNYQANDELEDAIGELKIDSVDSPLLAEDAGLRGY